MLLNFNCGYVSYSRFKCRKLIIIILDLMRVDLRWLKRHVTMVNHLESFQPLK